MAYNKKQRYRTEDIIELELKVDAIPVYKDDSNWGLFGTSPVDESNIAKFDLKLNKYNSLSLKGIAPKLEIGAKYKVQMYEQTNPTYGTSYEIIKIWQDIPTSMEDQKEYIKAMVTDLQFKAIYDVYEGQDVIQLFKDNTFEWQKVYNMGEKNYIHIKEKILGNLELQILLAEFSQYGLNYNMIQKIMKNYTSAQLLIDAFNENPYILTEIDGFGFKTCDKYALKMGIPEDSPFRIGACIDFILEEQANNNGHCWISFSTMINGCHELMRIDKKIIKEHMLGLNKATKLDEGANVISDKYFIDEENKVIALGKYRYYEKEIARHLKSLLSYPSKVIAKKEDIEKAIKQVEEKFGFELTKEQREFVYMVCDNNVALLTGKAGTGKTSSLKVTVNAIRLIMTLISEACALSGKAAQRITESTGIRAKTIHRLLEYNHDGGFAKNEYFPLETDLVVLDEASMVSSILFYNLISAVPKGSKIIILGDTEQLEAIGVGAILKDMIDSGKIPHVELTEVHRQAKKSGILSIANQVREGIQFNKEDDYENRKIGELGDLLFYPYRTQEKIKAKTLDIARKFKGNIMEFQVIVPLKDRGDISARTFNEELQEIFNPDPFDDMPTLERNNYKFRENDKIIQCGNNYDFFVFNGTQGIVKEVDVTAKKITIDFVGVGLVTYTLEQMSQIELAYALTVHRVQGSQFETVVFAFDYSAYKLLCRQLIYTALTRASRKCYLICENKALYYAVSVDKASKRNTFLCDFLKAA